LPAFHGKAVTLNDAADRIDATPFASPIAGGSSPRLWGL